MFYSWDVSGLGPFRDEMFWGLERFDAWDVLELGRFEDGTFWGLRPFRDEMFLGSGAF
jgi:hypothetical protein